MITVHELHPRAQDLVGYIPMFLSEDSVLSAKAQFNINYAHGGGWRPMDGWDLRQDFSIKYPGDPAYKPVARIDYKKERIFVYEHAWVCIVQPDGTFEIARMD